MDVPIVDPRTPARQVRADEGLFRAEGREGGTDVVGAGVGPVVVGHHLLDRVDTVGGEWSAARSRTAAQVGPSCSGVQLHRSKGRLTETPRAGDGTEETQGLSTRSTSSSERLGSYISGPSNVCQR